MKTQVFHYFREIGNGLIFVQLIERALNQQEMHDMIQAAPFRRQFPRIHIKEGERYESKEGFKIVRFPLGFFVINWKTFRTQFFMD